MRQDDTVNADVVVSTPDAGLDPKSAAEPEQYVKLLERVRRRSGLSFRAIARRALIRGQVMPASTLATMLRRATLPRRELVTAFLAACEVPVDRQAIWLSQWLRLAEGRTGRSHASAKGLDPVAERPADGVTAACGAPIPRQLPASPTLFAGRSRELARINDAVGRTDSVVILTVVGGAGMGKTWLALRWAHDNLDRYPDGQLHLNLRGFDPSGRPTAPDEAVRTFLPALGVAPAAIPNGLDAQVGLYRSLVAGKRMLIVLDNVRDADQVRPLLPGAGACTVIITSRHQLASLTISDDADLLTLDLLPPADAHRLLACRLGEHRLAAEPAATTEIIDRCAGLPLALALVAARAASQPGRTLSALADALRDSHDRLDALGGDAPNTDIRTLLSWSYDALAPAAARLFRLLGLHPGPEISLPAMASLAGIPIRQARRLLAELIRAHLANEVRPDRYTLHDLLRVYAAEQVDLHDSDDQRRAAIGRVLDHYLCTANTASLVLQPYWDPITVAAPGADITRAPLITERDALAWYSGEHHALVAAIWIAEAGFESHVWGLADALSVFFTRQGHWHDWHTTTQAALCAAQRVHDPCAQARAHCWLAELYAWIGRYEDTGVHLDQANALFKGLGDTAGLAYVHLCRGWVHEPRRAYQQALHDAEQALRLYTAIGHKRGQANALNNIGWYHAQLGDRRQAIKYCQQALTQHQQLGDRGWEARTWDALGYAHHHLGHYEKADTCYEHALRLLRERGNRYRESLVLNRLGETRAAAGRAEAAQHAWRLAHEILVELQHPDAHHLWAKLQHSFERPSDQFAGITWRVNPSSAG